LKDGVLVTDNTPQQRYRALCERKLPGKW